MENCHEKGTYHCIYDYFIGTLISGLWDNHVIDRYRPEEEETSATNDGHSSC